jgi:hypothetical protein
VIRLSVLVEGPTEGEFVRHVLGPHLDERQVFTRAIVVETRRERSTGAKHAGGGRWSSWLKNLRDLTRDAQPDARFSTLFDLYRLPDDFPERALHATIVDTRRRVDALERAMGASVNDSRFIPYLQRHELEALVLVGLDELEALLDSPEDRSGLSLLRAQLRGLAPEDVDDGDATAPSKRLLRHVPSYRKTLHGPLALQAVGLSALRAACPRFDAWVTRLERLSETPLEPKNP